MLKKKILLAAMAMTLALPATAATIRFTYDQEATVADTFSSALRQGPGMPSPSDPGAIAGFGGTVSGFLDVDRSGPADAFVDWRFAVSIPRGQNPNLSSTDAFTDQLTHDVVITPANSTGNLASSGGQLRLTFRHDFQGPVNNDVSDPARPLTLFLRLVVTAGLGPEGSSGYRLDRAAVQCQGGATSCTSVFRDDVSLWNGTSGNPLAVSVVPVPAGLPLLLSALGAAGLLRRTRQAA